MWSTTITVQIFLINLLLVQTLAGRYDVRKRNFYTVQHDVVVTEQVDVVVQPDGSIQTSPPKAVETMSYFGTPSLVVEATPTPIAPPPPTEAEQNKDDALPEDSQNDATPESPVDDAGLANAANPTPQTEVPAPDEDLTSDSQDEPFQTQPEASVSPTPAEQPESSAQAPDSKDPSENETPATFPDVKPEIIIPSENSNKFGGNKKTTGGKRGIAFNDAQKINAFSSSSKVSWAYNWGSSTTSIPQQYEYVPMLWGLGKFTDGWSAAADKALASGSTHILSFNEPDLGEQASLTIPEAAEGYRRYIQPYAGKAKLGSPAVTNGGAPLGLAYLTGFMVACADCTIDFIAIHWYNGGNAQDFKDYVTKAHILGGGRPVWITEFEASGDPAQQQAFLNDVLPWLDSQDFVERYAYFMASDGNLISSGTSLSTVGQAFAFD